MAHQPATSLSKSLLTNLMLQVGLPGTADAASELLLRINQLSSQSSGDECQFEPPPTSCSSSCETDEANSDADSVSVSDGYDTVCDDDLTSCLSSSSSRTYEAGTPCGRNNNGKALNSGVSSATAAVATGVDVELAVEGIQSLQSHMESTVMTAIEKLRMAFEPLLQQQQQQERQQNSSVASSCPDTETTLIRSSSKVSSSATVFKTWNRTSNSLSASNNASIITSTSDCKPEGDQFSTMNYQCRRNEDLEKEENASKTGSRSRTPSLPSLSDQLDVTGPQLLQLKNLSLSISSINEATHCSRVQRSMVSSSSPPPLKPLRDECEPLEPYAKQLVETTEPIDQRLLQRQRQMAMVGRLEAPTSVQLAERLANLEFLLLSLQGDLHQHKKGLSSKKMKALVNLKKALGCLQVQLLQLQAREVSQVANKTHAHLDRTWNFRRNWRPLPTGNRRSHMCNLADAVLPGDRPNQKDRWLLKYLPRSQRRALPELMRTVGKDVMGAAAGDSKMAITRARGRQLTAHRLMRDPHQDVIQRFLHALQP